MIRHIAHPEARWAERPAVLVAAGPSATSPLAKALISAFCFRNPVIAVKDGYLLAPNADVLLCGDHRWSSQGGNPDLTKYNGPVIVYTDPTPCPWKDPRIEVMPKVAGSGLSKNPGELRGTYTSTALAINYAALKGAKDIYLIGVDGKEGPNGERHFGSGLVEDWSERYGRQAFGYRRLVGDLREAGVRVYNLNPDSAVDCFPKLDDRGLSLADHPVVLGREVRRRLHRAAQAHALAQTADAAPLRGDLG